MAAGVSLVGRYRLVERIGAGGFGTVFRARDQDLGRDVAVKVLRPDPDGAADVLARFDREAKLMAGVRHPNVVAVYDRGTHEGVAFVVMELLAGPDLATVVRQGDPLPVAQVLGYATQVAAGLGHLHGLPRPVIHRDLKPSNLLLDGDVVKIGDFGIAIAPGVSRYTHAGVVIGSLHYMSPEQCRGDEATAASDVYAFGAVLYCLLAGEPPFSSAGGFVAGAQRILHEPPDPIGRYRPDVPDVLAELIHAMLAKAAPERPDAATVVRELTAMVAPAPAVGTAPATRRASESGGVRGELAAAEQMFAEGAYVDAAERFTALARRLDADGRDADPARFAAEFGRVRAADALGRGGEAAARWGRLLARVTAELGEDHDLARQVRKYGELRSR